MIITLNNGYEALIDDEIYDYLSRWKWHYNSGYAVAKSKGLFDKKVILMHRVVMNVSDNSMEVDHINGNKLDNRKENLRLCKHYQNGMNRNTNINSMSGYKGVYQKYENRWCAQIKFNYKNIFIGYFDNPEDAARAYDQKARELYGEYAKTNFAE